MKYQNIATALLECIHASNIDSVTHCSTRLRISIRDLSTIDKERVKSVEGVLGVVTQGNTLQIIFGPEVERVHAAFTALLGGEQQAAPSAISEDKAKKENWFSRMLSFLAAAFLPTMPVVIATGLITALLNILVLTVGLSTTSATYQLISAIAGAGFFFLPLYVGYGSAKQLNINPVYGIFLGAVLVSQGINGVEGLSLFGLPMLATTYSYTGLPVMFGVLIMGQIHKLVVKVIPQYFKEVLVPLLVIGGGTLATLFIVGPLGVILGDWMTKGFVFVYDTIGWLALGLVGALFGFTVLTGTNKALVPIMVTTLAAYGYDTFLIPAMLGTNIAVGTAALAVAVMEKDKSKRATQISAGITGLMGISEPSLFGVLLGDRKALYGSMIGGGVGGLLAGAVKLAQNSIVSGLPGLPTMVISIPPYEGLTNLYWGIAVIVVSGLVGFFATLFLKKHSKK